MDTLLKNIKKDFPKILFKPGNTFLWSPRQKIITYKSTSTNNPAAIWSLLHELGHATLNHSSFASDFDLLLMESAAWDKAQELAKKYRLSIESNHIQDCLDTYRDWLYQRSTCPGCTSCSLQTDSRTYECFNCGTTWHVSQSRMCRPYRRLQKVYK